jgi:murein DD-endopeptidase MepM/ murein hydrolase activator NlpD
VNRLTGAGGLVGIGAAVVVGAVALLLIPMLWLASEAPARPICGFVDGGLIVTTPDPSLAADGHLSAEQSFFASVIVSEAARRKLPAQAAVIAVATAITESGLRNPDQAASDLDSSGLFQQRAISYPDIDHRDPVQAANAFLDRLVAVPGWETMELWLAAATVQRPREDLRTVYAKHAEAAAGIVQALWEKADELAPCGRGAVLAGSYTLPVAKHFFETNPEWFTKPHHDYAAADIPVPAATEVYAVTGGTVISSPAGGSCGNGVIVDGDDGVRYTYCHGTTAIAPRGVHVSVGELIMTVGWTGSVQPPGPAGAHLHLQMQLGSDGPYVCPQQALVGWAQGVAYDPASLPQTGCSN